MSIANGDPYFLVATKQLGLYFQDDWKVSRRLTLNLGLRWDKDFNMIGGADIKTSRTYQELVALNSPISNPYVSRIASDDNKDFSPRVGFAYDVTEAEYTHVLGLHENKTINIDQRVPVGGVCCTRPLHSAFAATTLPELASVRNDESIGRSHYDGMNISLRRRMSHHVSINANYTLARAYSYDGGGGSFRNYPRLSTTPFASYEWGPSPNDERHHVTLSGIVELPKGFQLAPIMQFGSARPYNLTNSSNTLNTAGGTAFAGAVPTIDPTNYLAFSGNNAGAQNCFYGLNGVAQGCTIARYDPLRGDPFFELDLRLAKNIKFRERMNLQLVAQAFNLTNRANYGNDFNNNIASTSTFGHPGGFINPSSTIVPLAVWGEFGARFTF